MITYTHNCGDMVTESLEASSVKRKDQQYHPGNTYVKTIAIPKKAFRSVIRQTEP